MDLLLLVFVWAFVRTIYIHRNGLSLFLFPPPKKKETNKAHIPLKSSSFPKKNIDTIIIINLYRLARMLCALANYRSRLVLLPRCGQDAFAGSDEVSLSFL